MNHTEQSKEESELVNEMEIKCKLSPPSYHNQISENKSNNNQDYYATEYLEEPASGRISGGSQESAFSSNSYDETLSQQEDSSDSDNNLSSGRSSSSNRDSGADNQSLEEVKLLYHHCNSIPRVPQVLALVDQVRVRFLDSLKNEKDDGSAPYDTLDISEMKKQLPAVPEEQEQSLAFRLISRFFKFQLILDNQSEKAVEKEIFAALESVKELLKFRQHYQISSARPDQFAKEFYILSGLFQFGFDKQQVPVLYLRACTHRKWSQRLDESFRRYVAWRVNELTKSNHGALISKNSTAIVKEGSFGICFDCINVSYSCLDMDFLRYLVRVLVHYYPTYCCYALCVDLPWLFRSVWKLVRSWLPEEAQNSVHLITSKELTDFIEESQIPNSINRANDLKASEKPISNKHKIPENWNSIKGIEEFAKELNMSSKEIKQFKNHVESVRKDYEQLGAI